MTVENVANYAATGRGMSGLRLRTGAEANSRPLPGVRDLVRVHLGGGRHLRDYDDVLQTAGPVGIWLWVIAAVGQTLVALVVAQFAARIALSGSSYQWASRLANPKIGWLFGWLTFWYLAIAVVAVDNALASQAFMPLFGMAGERRHRPGDHAGDAGHSGRAGDRLHPAARPDHLQRGGHRAGDHRGAGDRAGGRHGVHRERRSTTSPRAASPPTPRTTSPSAAA